MKASLRVSALYIEDHPLMKHWHYIRSKLASYVNSGIPLDINELEPPGMATIFFSDIQSNTLNYHTPCVFCLLYFVFCLLSFVSQLLSFVFRVIPYPTYTRVARLASCCMWGFLVLRVKDPPVPNSIPTFVCKSSHFSASRGLLVIMLSSLMLLYSHLMSNMFIFET